MTESNGTNMVMPVAPSYGGGYGNGFGGDWGWIILLLLCANGGWGFGGFGGMGGMMGLGMMDGFGLYPWMNQAEITTNGFQNAQLGNQLTAVQSDLGDIQTQLCSGFAGVNATINSTAANAETAANARAMADMQQNFAIQNAVTDCCCKTQSGIADVKYTIANEGCQTRANATDNTRAILDKLCQLELDGVKAQVEAKNDRIAELQTQLNMANLAASQTAQTAALRTAAAETANLAINEMRSCPIPSQPVYGNTPIFTCNNGCGCGVA